MKKSLIEYFAYLDSEEEFSYSLRMEYIWNEEQFIKLTLLIKEVLDDYKDEDIIPKCMVYFFARDVDIIIGITNRDIFFNDIPDGYTREKYIEMVQKGKTILVNMKNDFFSGKS